MDIVDTVDTADIVHTVDTLDIIKSVNGVDNVNSVNSVNRFNRFNRCKKYKNWKMVTKRTNIQRNRTKIGQFGARRVRGTCLEGSRTQKKSKKVKFLDFGVRGVAQGRRNEVRLGLSRTSVYETTESDAPGALG